jgi:molybdenum cofactor cytidylyltransferase
LIFSATPAISPIAGVVLAAGESSRMGRDKALLPFGQAAMQSTFVEHLAHVLDGEVSPLLVVVGHHADEIRGQIHLPAGAEILINSNYKLGQLSSLRVALQALRKDPVAGLLLCLVDHPAIHRELVRTLLDRFRRSHASILIPTFQGRRGHPVLFASRLFSELEEAPLDQGARWVVRRHEKEVELCEVEEEGILWDIDRPQDYEALQRRFGIFSGKRAPAEEHS